MLKILVPGVEAYDEEKNEFVTYPPVELRMEHSLISVSKWEARWRKAFLTDKDKTPEETLDYFRCMTINTVGSDVYDHLTTQNISDILHYIDEPMTAVYTSKKRESTKGDTPLSEVLYYYMISLGIPFECEKWHLNKLLALIDVCSRKNSTGKKMSKGEIMRRNAELNAARRKKLGTKG